MEVYRYRLYDPRTGKLVHCGTGNELVEQGVYRSVESLATSYAAQKKRGTSSERCRFRMEREKIVVKCTRAPRVPQLPAYLKVVQMKLPVYRCYDAEGKLVGSGTARELYEAKILSCMDAAYLYRKGGVCRATGVCRMERVYETRQVEQRRQSPPAPVKSEPAAGTDKDPLREDVRELCRYNAMAKKLGRRELSYGYWAAAGKPEQP